jgi:phage baseplate assembly protein gpV
VAILGLSCDAFPLIDGGAVDLIQYEDGSAISYDPAAHVLTLALATGAAVRVVADGGARIEGDLHVTGAITADGDVKAGDISLTSHRHSGVSAGTAMTGAPL